MQDFPPLTNVCGYYIGCSFFYCVTGCGFNRIRI